MDYTDVLDIRAYIPMLLVVLIPIGLIRDLKYLVPFSALANIFILTSFIITLYYIFGDSLDAGDKKNIANVEQLPLFFATVIFAMEGIGVVSTFTDILLSMRRKFFKCSFAMRNKIMANGRHMGYGLEKIDRY
jgi:amino acid permease